MDSPSLENDRALSGDGNCPWCGGSLTYFFWPIDAFVCPADGLSWSSTAALDHRPGLTEYAE